VVDVLAGHLLRVLLQLEVLCRVVVSDHSREQTAMLNLSEEEAGEEVPVQMAH
jgi:hypothetical protein